MLDTKYRRISKGSSFALILVSILFDLLELLVDWIPIVGQIISIFIDIIATATFALWFAMLGVGLMNPKTSKNFWITNLVELLPIPVLDTGVLTFGVISTILNVWKEDKGDGGEETVNPNVVRVKRG
jgi:hypothetical protein